MTPFDAAQGAQSVYNFWLGLVPQFFAQLGQAPADGKGGTPGGVTGLDGLMFPMEQFAKAATATQQSLAQAMAPMLQAGAGIWNPWLSAMPAASSDAKDAGSPGNAAQALMAPWIALMSGAMGAPGNDVSLPGAPALVPPSFHAMQQAWIDATSRLFGATPAQLNAAFDRTYGALGDALGLRPARELQSAWQEMVAANAAQQEARASYALLVQGALAEGLRRLMTRLADKGATGERVTSVLALIRLWAVTTEEAVHETLQSEAGLAATAALARSALGSRKRMRQVVDILADQLDIATRRELDEAYREIQEMKRELRALRAPRAGDDTAAEPRPRPRTRTRRKTARPAKGNPA